MRKSLHYVLLASLLLFAALSARGVDEPAPPAAPTQQTVTRRPAPSPADVLTDKPPTAPGRGDRVYVIPVHGEINDITAGFVKRCIDQAAAEGATTIVIDLETPGGGLKAAMDICTTIKSRPIHTVAWVHHHAYSAGALISMACKQIVVAPNSAIGDCAPIAISTTGELVPLPDTERDKLVSPIRAEFRDSAEANGYPVSLSLAMVSLGPAVYRIKDTTSGAVRYATATELVGYGLSTTSVAQPAGATAASSAPPAAHWVIDKKVHDDRQLLTMSAAEAIDFGFAKAYVADDAELMRYLQGDPAHLRRFEPTWSEQLVPWLTSMPVRALLIVVFLIALFVEMSAPGLSLSGGIAVAALAILLGAPYLTGLADVMDILLVIVGLMLIAGEIFVLPGHLVLGITGIVMVFVGLVMTFVPKEAGPNWIPQTPGAWTAMQSGIAIVLGSTAVAAVGMIILSRFLPRIPLFGGLVLQATLPGGAALAGAGGGTVTAPAATEEPAVGTPLRIGALGRVTAGLRPVGRAEFEDQLTDVVTRGEWIDAGRRVRIIAIEGNNIIVTEG